MPRVSAKTKANVTLKIGDMNYGTQMPVGGWDSLATQETV